MSVGVGDSGSGDEVTNESVNAADRAHASDGANASDRAHASDRAKGVNPAHAADPAGPEGVDPAVAARRHVLIHAEEDRWAWRRRIRQHPKRLWLYRVGVGIAGLLSIVLGVLTGPLPGPGGIPLVLLGLAIWSSEFEWAYRLRLRVKAKIVEYRGWPVRKKILFWVLFTICCGVLAYGYLLVLGAPFWVPSSVEHLLEQLPGVHRATG